MGLLWVSWRCSAYLLHRTGVPAWTFAFRRLHALMDDVREKESGYRRCQVYGQFLKNEDLSPGTSKNEFFNF